MCAALVLMLSTDCGPKFCLWSTQPHVPKSKPKSSHIFCSMHDGPAVQNSAAVFLLLAACRQTHAGAIGGCFMTPCTRARSAQSPFFSGAVSAVLWPGASPGCLVPSPLANCTTMLTMPMLKSVSSVRRRHAGHDGEIFCGPPVRIMKQRKNKLPWLWLGLPSPVVLVGRHDAGSPCQLKSVADVVDNRQDVASVISNWPAITQGFPRFSLYSEKNLLSVPASF